ncbi:MAG: (E)-4-hydroxy-3-methylbut-2-enyl-diphosphate synthase [Elusimicrobia bacterium]|nr:(E)-4-hydroxy-3-methylbut-2-enyl-diphosphate synthase [Elusimicrobiota bacterium]
MAGLSAVSALKHCESLFQYRRRRTRVVPVGSVGVGGDNPIRVQSMTTTDTLDVGATARQALKMVEAGCEIVRITAPTVDDARALGRIKERLLKQGVKAPLVADIHFSPAAAMEAADYVEKVRINPGNFVDTKRFAVKEYSDAEYEAELERIEARFTPLVEKLKRLRRALRIGTNHGSLSDRIMNRYGDSPLGMVESALEFVRICEKNGFYDVILSMKASNPKVMIAAYRLLAARMAELGMDYPFHLGVTEAGDGEDGRIKSAIGIGSLLADGIGDTIRVSLTEDPELEVSVCYVLAAPFQGRPASEGAPADGTPHCSDLFCYSRRKAAALKVGPFALGGSQPVRVVTAVDPAARPEELLALLEAQLKKAKGADPEILSFSVRSPGELSRLKSLRQALAGETSRLAFLARCDGPLGLALEALSCCDLASWDGRDEELGRWLEAARAEETRVLFEAERAERLIELEALARRAQVVPMLGLKGSDFMELWREYRILAGRCSGSPIHLRAPRAAGDDEQVLQSALLIGGLLCDGVGDSVEIDSPLPLPRAIELAYNVLQGAGVRITKTEYVSCPSCGRTLFDLQSTTERIKSKTGHLKGVKIAIMGCIVNGPGEMADADFGYVGGAPGKINLYVGKECVQKGIPTELADQALIDLIKAHGKWVEPSVA